jgi:hypothetical protein
MKHRAKLESEQQSRQTGTEQQVHQPAGLEFATADELLRYDAARTPVPAAVAQRLQQSTGESPAHRRPWWSRIFKGSKP